VRQFISTRVKSISWSKWRRLSRVLHCDKTLRTFEPLEKWRKHSPAARFFYISLVFLNARRVLSQCNTRLRLLYLSNKTKNYEQDYGWLKEKNYNKREWKERMKGSEIYNNFPQMLRNLCSFIWAVQPCFKISSFYFFSSIWAGRNPKSSNLIG